MKLPPKFRGIRAGNGDQEDQHNEFHEGLDESPEPTHGSFTTWDSHGPLRRYCLMILNDPKCALKKWDVWNMDKGVVYAW